MEVSAVIDLALTREDSARERARWAARARHGNARVLVIGAGVTGLTTALVLARRGSAGDCRGRTICP
jgi:heterodisulfide reductase subunit A-like polyferredoxin